MNCDPCRKLFHLVLSQGDDHPRECHGKDSAEFACRLGIGE